MTVKIAKLKMLTIDKHVSDSIYFNHASVILTYHHPLLTERHKLENMGVL